jgi:hypothetical protein
MRNLLLVLKAVNGKSVSGPLPTFGRSICCIDCQSVLMPELRQRLQLCSKFYDFVSISRPLLTSLSSTSKFPTSRAKRIYSTSVSGSRTLVIQAQSMEEK